MLSQGSGHALSRLLSWTLPVGVSCGSGPGPLSDSIFSTVSVLKLPFLCKWLDTNSGPDSVYLLSSYTAFGRAKEIPANLGRGESPGACSPWLKINVIYQMCTQIPRINTQSIPLCCSETWSPFGERGVSDAPLSSVCQNAISINGGFYYLSERV